MAYINLNNDLPGVTGLLEYSMETAAPLRVLTQVLLRGENTLTEGERELIASIVSHRNSCVYCTTSHVAAANAYLNDISIIDAIKEDIETAPISEKMKALLTIASQVQENGKKVTETSIARAKNAGALDKEIHDTVMIAALFSFYNRYVDGMGTYAPTDPQYYTDMAIRLKDNGYYRPTNGYSKNNNSYL